MGVLVQLYFLWRVWVEGIPERYDSGFCVILTRHPTGQFHVEDITPPTPRVHYAGIRNCSHSCRKPVLAETGQCSRTEVTEHPKIGLVLGGGGARGFRPCAPGYSMAASILPLVHRSAPSISALAGANNAVLSTFSEWERYLGRAVLDGANRTFTEALSITVAGFECSHCGQNLAFNILKKCPTTG